MLRGGGSSMVHMHDEVAWFIGTEPTAAVEMPQTGPSATEHDAPTLVPLAGRVCRASLAGRRRRQWWRTLCRGPSSLCTWATVGANSTFRARCGHLTPNPPLLSTPAAPGPPDMHTATAAAAPHPVHTCVPGHALLSVAFHQH